MTLQPRDELAARVSAEAEAQGWWTQGASAVAAVSGGPDSMALLHLMKTLAPEHGMRIVVAHANHQFRGAESDAEAEMVARTAREWGYPCEIAELGMPAYIADTGMNAQAASREKRYAFLKEVAKRHGCSLLLFGHHAGDQAETVLMRLIRGTGPGGLSGIPQRRTDEKLELLRPLLRITKRELLDYCKRNEVPYALDSSNVDRHYFRNAVRLDAIPYLERYNPQLQASLVRLADMAGADDDYLEAEAAKAFRRIAGKAGEGFLLDRKRLAALHVALQRRLIKLILSCSSSPRDTAEYRRVEEIASAARQESPAVVRFDIGDGWILRREYDEVYIGPEDSEARPYSYLVAEPDCELTIGETGERVTVRRMAGAPGAKPGNRREAYFDANELSFPLTIRSRRPGDVLEPDGLNGTKKVQDMFVDAKVPRSRRNLLPLLVDGSGRVLWIPGMRRSSHALVSGETESTLHVAFAPGEN